VVPAETGRAVVDPAGFDRGGVKGVHLRTIPGGERDVKPTVDRLPVGFDEQRRPLSVLPAEPADAPENSKAGESIPDPKRRGSRPPASFPCKVAGFRGPRKGPMTWLMDPSFPYPKPA
jgi:hypothetical protein